MVVASPHSGRDYPADFVASARLDAQRLRGSEDSYVDQLLASAPSHGAPLLAARFPRAFCDVNREAWELDPAMFDGELPAWVNTTSPRVSAGLGTIPRVIADGEPIYAARLPFAEAERRVRDYWGPYHAALAGLIEATRVRFGYCLLLDCHSMPSQAAASRQTRPDIVLGDAYGMACAGMLVRHVETFLAARGYIVRRNAPYAGGYITRHYGRPTTGVHALQIELARCLYMDESTLQIHSGFTRVADDMSALLASLPQTGWS
jgi:N-formylglutamate deformylase